MYYSVIDFIAQRFFTPGCDAMCMGKKEDPDQLASSTAYLDRVLKK